MAKHRQFYVRLYGLMVCVSLGLASFGIVTADRAGMGTAVGFVLFLIGPDALSETKRP